MLAGRLPAWLFLCAAAGVACVLPVRIATAQAPPVAAPDPKPQIAEYVPTPGTCVPISDSTGLNLKDALQRINPKYYQRTSHPEPSSLPPGVVLRMPTPKFIEGTYCSVDFAYSDGSLTKVPSVVGATREDATQRLAAADLQIAIVESPSVERSGLAFAQRPGPDQEVARQSSVEVTIALPILHDVPAVIGLQYEKALPQLAPFAVQRRDVAGVQPPEEIVDQEPRAPAQLPAEAVVRVDVADGSLVPVPALEGRPLEEARVELEQVALQASVEEGESDLAIGIIASQDPPAETRVPRGTAVNLVISSGLPVPNVIGRELEDASRALRRFAVTSSAIPGKEPKGQVVDQVPKSGTRAEAGSAIALTFSDGAVPASVANGGSGNVPWIWLVGAVLALAALARVHHKYLRAVNFSARLDTPIDNVQVGPVAAEGPSIRIAARLEFGE